MFKCLSAEALGISTGQSETIEAALSFGFKGVDIDIASFAAHVNDRGLPHARRLLDSAKLKIGYFRLPIDLESDDAAWQNGLTALDSQAALAASLGCTRCLTWVAPASNDRHFHQNFEFHRTRFTDVARLLDAHGIRLGIGFHAAGDLRQGRAFEFIRTFDALGLLVSVVQAKNVGVVVDGWDLAASGGSIEALQKIGAEKIVAVQLADAPQNAAEQNWTSTARLLPGETGVVDSPAVLAALAAKGYDGPITPVPDPSRFQGIRRDAIVRLTGEQLDKVWKAAGLTPAGKPAPTATPRPTATSVGRR